MIEPLVEPAAALSPAEQARYARHTELQGFGLTAQLRLKNARVLVIGAGGLGSAIVPYLAAAGVGVLGIVDDDVVDLSNLQRQVMHSVATIGMAKTESAKQHVQGLNPHVEVVTHRLRLTAGNALEIVRNYDLVLDGADNFATRYLVSDAAEILGIPCVWGSILQFEGQLSVFWRGQGPTYRDVFPEPPEPGEVPSCAQAGVLGVLPGQIGTLMAAEAIKLITGIGAPLLGRLMLFDALQTRWREMRVVADPGRPAVEALMADYPTFCGLAQASDQVARLTLEDFAASLVLTGPSRRRLIDVRQAQEAQMGMIDSAELLPLPDLLQMSRMQQLLERMPGLSEQDPVVLYCQSGQRAMAAAAHLHKLGFKQVQVLEGNVAAWRAYQAAHVEGA